MEFSDLKERLKKYDESELNSILIDGPWGCGKTTFVKKLLDEQKIDYLYFSLFGINDVKELISKLMLKINNMFFTCINEEFEINDNNKNGRKSVIVFDDFERINDINNFIKYFGIFEKLKNCNFRLIVITNSSVINTNNIYFESYKEKVFDFIANVSINKDIFGLLPNEIALSNNDLKTLNYNGRLLIKTIEIFNDIMDPLKNNNEILKSPLLIFEYCMYVVKIVFDYENIKNDMLKSKDFNLTSYFGENISIDLKCIGYLKENGLSDVDIKLIATLKDCYLRGSYEQFISNRNIIRLFYESILDYRFDLLSDIDQNEYINKVLNLICDNEELNKLEKYITIISLQNDIELDKKQIKIIIDYLLKLYSDNSNIVSQYLNKMMDRSFYINSNGLESEYVNFNNIFNQLNDKIYDLKINTNYEYFSKNFVDKDYIKMKDSILIAKKMTNNEKIKKYLLDNSFCISNLSKSFTDEEWDYIITLTEFIRDLNDVELLTKYKKIFFNMYSKDKNSKSLLRKCENIFKHCLNLSFLDEFKKYDIDKKLEETMKLLEEI